MKRTLATLFCAVLIAALCVTALAEGYDKTITFSDGCLMVTAGDNFYDELYDHINEMFNFKMDIWPMNWDNYHELPRIWMNSDEAPDIFVWDFNFTDYLSWIDQGLIEPLPEDYAEKYPNLAKAISKTSLTEFLKEKAGGRLYCVPHVQFRDPPSNPLFPNHVLHYRKDWADKVGVTVGDTITLDELFDLAKKFVEEDPGENGPGNTIGLTIRTEFLNIMVMNMFNKNFDDFYLNGDTYAWGPMDEATFEGLEYLKKQYDAGLIDRDFYTYSGNDYYDKFNSGKAGMMFGTGHGNEQNTIRIDFQVTNPDLNVDDVLGTAVVVGNDGVWRGSEEPNYWTVTLFKAGIDPEVMDRILAIQDYLCSDEGYRFVRMGIEGKDYVWNGDVIEPLREKDPETGIAVDIMNVYPSQRVWVFMSVLDDQWGMINPELPEYIRTRVENAFKIKAANNDYKAYDWDAELFTGPYSDKFSVDFGENIVPDLITKDGDLRANWEAFKAENQDMVERVIAEMNAGILGK